MPESSQKVIAALRSILGCMVTRCGLRRAAEDLLQRGSPVGVLHVGPVECGRAADSGPGAVRGRVPALEVQPEGLGDVGQHRALPGVTLLAVLEGVESAARATPSSGS